MFNVGDDEHCWWLSQVVRTYLPEMRHFFLPFSSRPMRAAATPWSSSPSSNSHHRAGNIFGGKDSGSVAVSSLQAYLIGFTCAVVLLLSIFFLSSSDDDDYNYAPRRRRGRNVIREDKPRRVRNSCSDYNFSIDGKVSTISLDDHFLRPMARSVTNDNRSRRRTRRSKRAPTRVEQQSKRTNENLQHIDAYQIDLQLPQSQCLFAKSSNCEGSLKASSTSVELTCRDGNEVHPIARNRSRYNQTLAALKTDFRSNEQTYALFKQMNAQPLYIDSNENNEDPIGISFLDDEDKENTVPKSHGAIRPIDEPNVAVESSARLTVLISNGVHDYYQASNQRSTFSLLGDFSIPHDVIDGMDPSQKEKRDVLFELSGIRGNYPQLFLTSQSGKEHRFLGGYDWLLDIDVNDLKNIVISDRQMSRKEGEKTICNHANMSPATNFPRPTLTVLVTNGEYDADQSARQKSSLDLLNELCIPFETVDGMDPLQRQRRDLYFSISGIRGNYPQFFFHANEGDQYLGGYDWLRKLHESEIADLKSGYQTKSTQPEG